MSDESCMFALIHRLTVSRYLEGGQEVGEWLAAFAGE